jgi:uncharacterized protein YaaQ
LLCPEGGNNAEISLKVAEQESPAPCRMDSHPMKLVIAVIHNRDKGRVVDALLESQFKFTQVASTGGFLREGNTTLLIGVEDSLLESLLRLLESNCRTREQYVNPMPPDAAPIGSFLPTPIAVEVGGAVVFVLPVERFERF